MSTSSVCLNIPDSVYYIIVVGAIAAIVGSVGNIFGMSCPFLSNFLQNRIHREHTGLLININEQIDARRDDNIV